MENCPTFSAVSKYKLIPVSSAISPCSSINFALIGFYGRLGLLTSPTRKRDRKREGEESKLRRGTRRVFIRRAFTHKGTDTACDWGPIEIQYISIAQKDASAALTSYIANENSFANKRHVFPRGGPCTSNWTSINISLFLCSSFIFRSLHQPDSNT